MTVKEYEISINMLMAQGRKLYCVRLMKDASKKEMKLLECKEHMDMVFNLFKRYHMLFYMSDYTTIYTSKFKSRMRSVKFSVANLHFFNINGELFTL